MTGKLLPFAHPAPRRAEPETPVRDRNPADDLAISLEIDIDELARAIVRETDQLETDPRSKRLGGGSSPSDDNDDRAAADGFLYADDDGPD